MEYSIAEVAVVEETANEGGARLVELDMLQLALVGGGIGDPIAA